MKKLLTILMAFLLIGINPITAEGNTVENPETYFDISYDMDFYIYSQPRWLDEEIYWGSSKARRSFSDDTLNVKFEDWVDNSYDDVEFDIKANNNLIIIDKVSVDTAAPDPTTIKLDFSQGTYLRVIEQERTYSGQHLSITLWDDVRQGDDTITILIPRPVNGVCDAGTVLVNGACAIDEVSTQSIDFEAKELKVNKDNSENPYITLTFDNKGNTDTARLYLYENGVKTKETVHQLNHNTINYWNSYINPRQGNNYYEVKIDPLNEVSETNENNNRVTTSYYQEADSDEQLFQNNPTKGSGSLTMKMYMEFPGPFDQRFANNVYPLIEENFVDNGLLKVEFVNFPLDIYTNAHDDAQIGECAHAQGRFWQYFEERFSDPQASVSQVATRAGVNNQQFTDCVNNEPYNAEVEKDTEEASNKGLSGTPSFIFEKDGREVGRIMGSQAYDIFEQKINELIGSLDYSTDLQITGIVAENIDGEQYTSGNHLIKAYALYDGDFPGSILVHLYVDGQFKQGTYWTPGNDGNSQWVSNYVNLDQGKHFIQVKLDPYNYIKEKYENNNELDLEYTVSSDPTDYSVKKIWIAEQYSVPGTIKIGAQLGVEGGKGSVTVGLYDNDQLIQSGIVTFTTQGIKDWFSNTISPAQGYHNYEVRIDPYNVISEPNEYNNKKSTSYTVEENDDSNNKPEIELTPITRRVDRGEEAQFVLKITDKHTDSGVYKYRISARSPFQNDLPAFVNIDAGKTERIEFELDTSSSLKEVSYYEKPGTEVNTYFFSVDVIPEDQYSYVQSIRGTIIVEDEIVPPTLPGNIFDLELEKGWNLVSVPGSFEKFEDTTCRQKPIAFVYSEEREEYLTIKEAKNYYQNSFNEYLSQHSFWVYSYQSCSLEILQSEENDGSWELIKGWNFIPLKEGMIGQSIKEIIPCAKSAYAYINGGWQSASLTDDISKENMGYGLIVKTDDNCDLEYTKQTTQNYIPGRCVIQGDFRCLDFMYENGILKLQLVNAMNNLADAKVIVGNEVQTSSDWPAGEAKIFEFEVDSEDNEILIEYTKENSELKRTIRGKVTK